MTHTSHLEPAGAMRRRQAIAHLVRLHQRQRRSARADTNFHGLHVVLFRCYAVPDLHRPVYAPDAAQVQTRPHGNHGRYARDARARHRDELRRDGGRRGGARRRRPRPHPCQRGAGAVGGAPPLRRRGAGDRRARACRVPGRDHRRGHARSRHRLPPPRRGGGDGRARPDRRPAGRRHHRQGHRAGARAAAGGGQPPGGARAHRRPHGRTAAALPAAAGLGRAHPAARGAGCRPLSAARHHHRRRAGGGLRQDRQAAGSRPAGRARGGAELPCRAEPSASRCRGRCWGGPEPHFSFAGLKTAVRHQAQALVPLREQDVADLCAAFEAAAADSVADRVRRAMRIADDELGAGSHRHLVVAGGVAANQRLRAAPRHTSPPAPATRCTCRRRRCARTTPPWSPGPAPSGWRAAGPTASTSPRVRAGPSTPTRPRPWASAASAPRRRRDCCGSG